MPTTDPDPTEAHALTFAPAPTYAFSPTTTCRPRNAWAARVQDGKQRESAATFSPMAVKVYNGCVLVSWRDALRRREIWAPGRTGGVTRRTI
ncbi:hypothetical protein ABZ572_38250 [Streptomyces sp. NPDC018338]|uniref:hypothetical protein n=1 Tax=Streptomyces sp. NPDC018338 TaxID=3157192 RepID=UPI0033CECD7B